MTELHRSCGAGRSHVYARPLFNEPRTDRAGRTGIRSKAPVWRMGRDYTLLIVPLAATAATVVAGFDGECVCVGRILLIRLIRGGSVFV